MRRCHTLAVPVLKPGRAKLVRPRRMCRHQVLRSLCSDGRGGATVCELGRRPAACVTCRGTQVCPHGTQPSRCELCGGPARQSGLAPCSRHQRMLCSDCSSHSVCPHFRRRDLCVTCGGDGICPGKSRHFCRDCTGKGICVHGRRAYHCQSCGGTGICPHGRGSHTCSDCRGVAVCEHGKRRRACPRCPCDHRSVRRDCELCRQSARARDRTAPFAVLRGSACTGHGMRSASSASAPASARMESTSRIVSRVWAVGCARTADAARFAFCVGLPEPGNARQKCDYVIRALHRSCLANAERRVRSWIRLRLSRFCCCAFHNEEPRSEVKTFSEAMDAKTPTNGSLSASPMEIPRVSHAEFLAGARRMMRARVNPADFQVPIALRSPSGR